MIGGGPGAFLVLVFALSWIPAWALRDAWLAGDRPLAERLLVSSLFYAVTMGWQPVFAALWVRPPSDPGLRVAERRWMLLAAAGPLFLVALAAGIAWLAGARVGGGVRLPALAGGDPTLLQGLALGGAFVATLSLLWGQALGEEIGWRGFFLPALMRRLGPWRGLGLHGLAWGVWYAPIFLLSDPDPERSLLRGAGFVVTCALLGSLLGWLRLASRSIVPATLANAVLTITAGLPFFLRGDDPGLRGSVLGPPGWLPMAALLALLVAGRGGRLAVERPAGA